MFKKVLVANRGAVAARVIHALKGLGVGTVAIYSEADAGAPYLGAADEAFHIGASAPLESYLNQEKILRLLAETGCDGLHPGYGFLSENADFAKEVERAGAIFIGPSPHWLATMGHKTSAIQMLASHGMPTNRSSGVIDDDEELIGQADKIGYPVLIKPAAGGGGIGMLAATDSKSLLKQIGQARSMAERSFSSAEIFLEKQLINPRHIEIQIMADRHGQVCHLFERDCSVQRRNQKVIEEAPAPNLDQASRDKILETVTQAVKTIGYDSIGTVEMLRCDGEFSFLEMNTRLQVEHGVTEEITGVDIVASQIQLAWGMSLAEVLPNAVGTSGHAVEARIYAEDPIKFYPSPGKLDRFRLPVLPGIRVDTGYQEGMTVTPFYDPLMAKIISKGDTRQDAIRQLIEALESCEIAGVKSNVPALISVLQSAQFRAGDVHTGLIADLFNRN